MPEKRRLTSQVLTWRSAIANSDLPRATRAVAWALANYMNERGESAFPSVPTLCSDVGNERGNGPASKRLVIDALRELCDRGYLTRERVGGGRGMRASYAAILPETVQQLHRNEVEADSPSAAGPPRRSGAPAASDEALTAVAGDEERVQRLHPLAAGETVQSEHERVHQATGKGAVTAPEVEVLEVDQEVAAATRARETTAAAAAVEIEERLNRLNVVGKLRDQALENPERAIAWLDLAEHEARRNPAGLFRIGFESGSFPSPRIDSSIEPTSSSPMEAKRKSLANLVELRLDADEIRHMIDVEWDTLASVERSELHEYLDEILSGPPDEQTRQLRAVDAA